mgnify:CR=1 FL=1
MRVTIEPCVPLGAVRIPASKSIAHRALIAAALTPGRTVIHDLPDNRDVSATLDCLRRLGAEIEVSDGTARVSGGAIAGVIAGGGACPDNPADCAARLRLDCGTRRTPDCITPPTRGCAAPLTPEHATLTLDCGESGTTLRLLIPVALLGARPVKFTGAGRLFARPLSVYEAICRRDGLMWERTENSVTVCGPLGAGDFCFPGNISSQFVSGLLLALPHVGGDSRIRLTTEAESASYIGLTLHTLCTFGYDVRVSDGGYEIPGAQTGVTPCALRVPTDQSAAAFFGALATLGGEISMTGFTDDGAQGDRVWRQYIGQICAGYCELSVTDCPDLAPVLMAVAALHGGVTLRGTARLRFKESDRGAAMAEELAKFGVAVDVGQNEIRVAGRARTPEAGTVLCAHNDHRIAMSLAAVACAVGGVIEGAECVAKSLPEFWDMLTALGVPLQRED